VVVTGAPTLLHKEWTEIGATQLLQPSLGACLLADMSTATTLAAAIQELVGGCQDQLNRAAEIACPMALAWGEGSYASELVALVREVGTKQGHIK
jgi:hypothetical protein